MGMGLTVSEPAESGQSAEKSPDQEQKTCPRDFQASLPFLGLLFNKFYNKIVQVPSLVGKGKH